MSNNFSHLNNTSLTLVTSVLFINSFEVKKLEEDLVKITENIGTAEIETAEKIKSEKEKN